MMATDHIQPIYGEPEASTGIPRDRQQPQRQFPFRFLLTSEPWRGAGFLLTSFIVGIFWFVLLVTLAATGFGLAITLIGIPILLATLFAAKLGGRAERWRINALLRDDIRDPYQPLPDGTFWVKLRAFVSDWAIWRDMIYLFLLFPIGVIEFVILTLSFSIPLHLLTMPFWYDVAQRNSDGPPWLASNLTEALLLATLAIPALLVGLTVIVGTTRTHHAFARILLAPDDRAELEERVTQLRQSRTRVMDAEMMELRRIERDLHDGAQQWLVATAIDLAMAKEKLDTDPEMARELIDKAGIQTRQALTDIRNLVRGISPAILVDRGLDPAISALAIRCPIPVHVDVDVPQRLPEQVETTAYFIVAEALTNIAKHANATEARVIARRFGDRLLLEIWDNGSGGADPRGGTGLTGLRDRATALDGELRIESPVGGPTRIRAELPCELS
jgi:signal transduction histidine kinase